MSDISLECWAAVSVTAGFQSQGNSKNIHGIAWKKLAAKSNAPGCLVLDGPNPLIPGEEEKFGPHGYLTLSFDGAQLVERVHLPDGTEIFSGQV